MRIGFGKLYRSKATGTVVDIGGIDTDDFRICGTFVEVPMYPTQIGLTFTIPVTNFIQLFEEIK